MLVLLAALLVEPSSPPRPAGPHRVAVRIRASAPHAVPPPLVPLREKHGPRCIHADTIAGAAVTAPDSVEFSLKGGTRVRARLEDACPALDYYHGFYVSPSADGRICAERDVIRTRSGGECGIDRFRMLVPVRQAEPPARP